MSVSACNDALWHEKKLAFHSVLAEHWDLNCSEELNSLNILSKNWSGVGNVQVNYDQR